MKWIEEWAHAAVDVAVDTQRRTTQRARSTELPAEILDNVLARVQAADGAAFSATLDECGTEVMLRIVDVFVHREATPDDIQRWMAVALEKAREHVKTCEHHKAARSGAEYLAKLGVKPAPGGETPK